MTTSTHLDSVTKLSKIEGEILALKFSRSFSSLEENMRIEQENKERKFCKDKGYEFGSAIRGLSPDSALGSELVNSIECKISDFPGHIYFLTSYSLS